MRDIIRECVEVAKRDYTFDDAAIRQAVELYGIADLICAVKWAPGYAVTSGGLVLTRRPCTREKHLPIRVMNLTSFTRSGHLQVRFQVGKASRAVQVHRLVAEHFLPPPAVGQRVVRHLDGDPTNNRVGNLAWGTQADNMADAVRHGTTLKGLKSPNAKLTPRRAELIRMLVEEGFSRPAVAKLFAVSPATVDRVVWGEAWGNGG